ncbi:AAA family ATPase [Clostridium grantii]|uniref:Wobble nucleotide-excising tRNase n=1 Tax=Clostridium grantii DSM 8605 TaxID=1121316 RepID=A0A1M5U6D1_9CLOT|nr:AAA family ATPase [Clostridium grantii]SHH58592.1 Wobble nucleotide-excising tRNase [Clostridium grantii DSM 8605]
MNEKQISAIKNLTISDATYNNCSLKPTYINFFFGNNGVGKTTIARAINKLRKPTNESPNVIADTSSVEFELGKTPNDYNILVYNQDFIDANIQLYGGLPGVFTMNEQNIDKQNQVAEHKKEKSILDGTIGKLKTSIESKKSELSMLYSSFQNDCWDKTKSIREAFPLTQTGYKRKLQFTEKVAVIKNPTQYSIDELKSLYETAFDPKACTYSLFSSINNTKILDTVEGIELLQKSIASSSETPFAQFIKVINATDWIRQGHEHYKENTEGKCPYCQQILPDDFETQIASCFDKQYQADIAALNTLLTGYKNVANTLFIPLQVKPQDVFPKLDLTEYTDKLAIFKSTIASNIQKITTKTSEPSSIVELEDTAPLLEELNSIINVFNKRIGENNNVVKSKQQNKTTCIKYVWELLAYNLQSDITSYQKGKKDISDAIQKLTEDITAQSEQAKKLNEAIAVLSSQIINTSDAVNSMNQLLRDSGFQGFSIQEHLTLQNVYSVVRQDGKPAVKLSEGEKNFIAFLYFYHLAHGNGNIGDAQIMTDTNGNQVVLTDGTDNRDKIVVIDDPVSSMDSSALFIVSSLVREMISICHNNVDYKDTPYKGDYIKQIFILTHNAYFHREITVNQVRHYRYVSFFHIIKNDNVSAIIPCVRDNRGTEENYNPVQNSYAALWSEYKEVNSAIPLLNVIRRILEYYFIQLCGYDGTNLQDKLLKENKDKFILKKADGTEDTTQLQIVASMLSYISSSSHGISDGLYFVDGGMNVSQCRTAFEMIFKYMEQSQHYDMMMETNY